MLVTIRVPDVLLVDRQIQSVCVHLDGRHCHLSIAADIISTADEHSVTHDAIRARARALARWKGLDPVGV